MAVEPDTRIGHDTVELDRVIAMAVIGRQGKGLPVPRDPGDRQRAGLRIERGIKRSCNCPVVGQAHRRPAAIVEFRLVSVRRAAEQNPPAIVECGASRAGISNYGVASSRCEEHHRARGQASNDCQHDSYVPSRHDPCCIVESLKFTSYLHCPESKFLGPTSCWSKPQKTRCEAWFSIE